MTTAIMWPRKRGIIIMTRNQFEEKNKALVYARSGSEEGLCSIIKKFYYVADSEDVRLSDNGNIERTIKGVWKQYEGMNWKATGRTRKIYWLYDLK